MNRSKMDLILRLLGLGWYVAVCIGGGSLGGYWLDSRLEISPVFTLAGLGIGIIAAFAGMLRMITAIFSAGDNSTDNSTIEGKE